MRHQAIIFDLFGTLVDNLSLHQTGTILSEIAEILDLPQQDFISLWTVDTWHQRAAGAFASLAGCMEHICQLLRRTVKSEQLKQACEIWLAYGRETLIPRKETLDLLHALRSSGYKLGIMTDCSHEVPFHWTNTLFPQFVDTTVFSCLVGMKKPDVRMYHLMCQLLSVSPEKCIYIGDGSSHELTGAAIAGMLPIRLLTPCDVSPDSMRPDAEEWEGITLSSLEVIFSFTQDVNMSDQYALK